jgi:hypothetical protein
MYSNVNTRGLSPAAIDDARFHIATAVTDHVAQRGIDVAVFCDVPGGLLGPGVVLEGRHDATTLRVAPDATASLRPPALPEGERARLVWAHADGPAWRACWPECQRVFVWWDDPVLTIPGAQLGERVARRRAYEAAMRDYGVALMRLLSDVAGSLWTTYGTPDAAPGVPDATVAPAA